MAPKKPKWAKPLTKKELKHIADTCEGGRATLRGFRKNVEGQKASGIVCFDCTSIDLKLKGAAN